jgi:prepilin-type N-terminal cleavage/methylation domain-containing protein
VSRPITEILRRRRRLVRTHDAGFTLIEVVVALLLMALVAVGLVPLLASGARASTFARLNTIGKNLSQLRINAIQNLPYYVAQNTLSQQGTKYADVLTDYYTNASTSTWTYPCSPQTSMCGATGVWAAAGSIPGGATNVPVYTVTFPTNSQALALGQALPASAKFNQTVYAEFLLPGSPPHGAVPASTLTNYVNNQPYNALGTSGQDVPPSTLLGLTVVTSWFWSGQTHSYRVYTEVADQGNDSPLNDNQLVVTSAGATALSVYSQASDGSGLNAEVGVAGASGTLSNATSANATASAAKLTRVDTSGNVLATASGASASDTAAPNSTVTPPATTLAAQSTWGLPDGNEPDPPCGWGAVGPTDVLDASASVSGGLPDVPWDSPTNGVLQTDVNGSSGAGGSQCGAFSFTPILQGSTPDPSLNLAAGQPIVFMNDNGGNAAEVTSSVSTLTPTAGSATPVTSTANVQFNAGVRLFPNVTIGGTVVPYLVYIKVTQATMTCTASSSTATASYTGVLKYWTSGGYVTYNFSWSSGSAAPSLPPLSTVIYSNGLTTVTLGNYISGWSVAGQVTQSGTAGLHNLDNIFTAVTVPVLGSSFPSSAVTVNIGHLSCVAEDNR